MDAYDFILKHMDTVPHLEALMLLWNSRPVGWTSEELKSRLYISEEKVKDLLRDLVRGEFVSVSSSTGAPLKYSYLSHGPEQDELMQQVDEAYRRDLVRVSTMIHAKTSPSVREFARAFLFKKEKDQ